MTKRSLIMAGGGLKVAYQAGVLQVWLDEAGLKFDHADGASGGTFNLVQYCEGRTGTQIADSWRDFPVLRSLSLNWRQYLKLFWAVSLMTYDGFRDVVLRGKWAIDWQKVRASPILGTFNAYNFSKNQLTVRTQDQLNEDYLVACVSLPMWFPPITIGGDRYIDAVYLTDANLMEAIARGADELWIIWTVSRKAIWGGGFVNEYFQIIETAGNGRLKLDIERIEASNAAIAAGGHGEFGRPIKIEMLAAEMPLHYLINFSSTAFTAAVEQGIADARAWCRARGIPLQTPNAGLLALTFNETMQGGFALGASDPEAGCERGNTAGTPLVMHATVQIDDLDRFLNVPEHPGGLSGTIDFPPIGNGIVASKGVFNLLEPEPGVPHVKLFVYELAFSHGGRSYYLSGRKYVHEHGNPVKETTTLYTTLHDGSDNSGPIVGAGVLTLNLTDLIRMLGTVRVHNARNKADALAALERFGQFFLGEMWDSYGIHLKRS